MPEVTFTYADPAAVRSQPQQASDHVPEWFQALESCPIPPASDEMPGFSVKECSPFRDALQAGYMLRLPQAVRVVTEGNKVSFGWRHDRDNFKIEGHPQWQTGRDRDWPHPALCKFLIPWAFRLPPGYMALVTHPLNRYDLPFLTCSGVIDSDLYASPLGLPFTWVAGDGQTVLDAGLPVAQVIPMLREEWDSTVEQIDSEALAGDATDALGSFHGYKHLHRSRKVWR